MASHIVEYVRQRVLPQAKGGPKAASSRKATGPRFAALRMGRDLPKPVATSPRIKRGGSAKGDVVTAAVAANRARTRAVLRSKQSEGRETLTAALLDSEMSAEQIIAALAASPQREVANPMLSALIRDAGPDLGPGDGELPETRSDADAVWDRARASVEAGR